MENRKLKQLKNRTMKQSVIQVLQYFSFFNYPPTIDEIYCFLETKTSRGKLQAVLEKMVEKGEIMSKITNYKLPITNQFPIFNKILNSEFYILNSIKHTPPQYSIQRYQILNIKYQSDKSKLKNISNLAIQQFNNWKKRYIFSQSKLNNLRLRLYIKLLSLFPQIQLMGLSGTLAMMNANINDDNDLFIITARNRLFTGRFISIVMGYVLGVRRGREQINQQKSEEIRKDQKPENPDTSDNSGLSDISDVWSYLTSPISADLSERHKNKLCLNLFFDEFNLKIPKRKQTEYVAHEVLQMKPLVNKNGVYERFLAANEWVDKIFPNVCQIFNYQLPIFNKFSNFKIKNLDLIKNFKFKISNYLGYWVESFLKHLQLFFINRHRTTEIITSSQLWFFPDDFEKKIQNFHG
jgi:hypothetical protein